MITRRLEPSDLPAMQAIVISADECGDLANPAHAMPEDQKALVLHLMTQNMENEYFRYFGAFDGSNLLFFAGFFMWTDLVEGAHLPRKPNYGIRGHWATRAVPLEYTIDTRKIFSDAYIATINAAVTHFEELGFTTFWVRRPTNPRFQVIAFQPFCLLSKYKVTNVHQITKGFAFVDLPKDAHLMGIDHKPLDYDATIVRYDKV